MWAGVTYAWPILTLKREEAQEEREGGCLVKHKDGTAIKEQFPFMGMGEWENRSAPGEKVSAGERVSAGKRVSTEESLSTGARVSSHLGEGRTLALSVRKMGKVLLYQRVELSGHSQG